jgi:predicted ATP-dependent endonuclease of OLD family
MGRVKISGELNKVVVDIEANASGAVALIGPNLTGKSLLLQCIYSRASSKIGRHIQFPSELTCDCEENDYVAIYVDAYRVAGKLYEVAIRDRLDIIRENAEFVMNEFNDIVIRRASEAIYRAAEDIEKTLNELQFALDAKSRADDLLATDAVHQLNDLYNEMLKKAEKAKNEFKEIFDDFFPLTISATPDGFVWTNREARISGRGLQHLSTAYSPALVALYAIYAYAIPQKTYLLVEEPEAHAHPLTSYFLGIYLQRLVKRSNGRLNVVVSTHSFDFIRGFWSKDTKVYILRRFIEGGKILLKVAGRWQGEGYVPGFTDVTLYRLI